MSTNGRQRVVIEHVAPGIDAGKLIADAYVDAYMQPIGNITGIFNSRSELNFLLQLHLLEKAVCELGYERNDRSEWVRIPLKGIRDVLNEIEKFN